MVSTPEHVFKTSDTCLSAYLVQEGFGTPVIEFNGTRAYFIFEKTNPLEHAVNNWDTAQAIGNTVLFFNAYQNLLRRIKERYQIQIIIGE